METKRICSSCGKPLPPNGPLGLCPECLIKSGFNTGTGPETSGKAPSFVPPSVAELAPSFPQLEILEFIGKGGMGAVYKARQPSLDRLVALKILSPATAGEPGFAERFNREARALARLNHPNIVAVHDFGKAGPLHFLVMEFVDGLNLREVERAGQLTPEQALGIVPQICEALQFAHNEGIVHRDIKPENLLLDKKGRVKITDFGIAKIVGITGGRIALTGAKDVVGTPHYMAPEQIEKPQSVDHRADIYSLGVVFYEMLTGELPLGKFQPPSRKVHVDVRLDEVVLHALEKEPERRYQHASVLKTEVETIAHSKSEFRDPKAEARIAEQQVRRQVLGPAIGLLATGVLNLGLQTLGLLFWGLGTKGQGVNQLLCIACVLAMGVSFFSIYAAFQMMALRRYNAAVVASVLGMFFGGACIVGFPIGIWALVILNRREVKDVMTAAGGSPGVLCCVSRPMKFAATGVAVLILGAALRLVLESAITVPDRCEGFFSYHPGWHVLNRLRGAELIRWDDMQIETSPNPLGYEAVWHFDGLRRLTRAGDATARNSLQGALRITPDGLGRWQVAGETDLSWLQFTVADDSDFGPLVERTISNNDADERGFVFFDLETGRSLPSPFPLMTRSNQAPAFIEITPALEQWIRANRMDVLVQFVGDAWNTMNLRMQEDFVPETAEWAGVTPQMVTNVFIRWDSVSWEREAVPASSQGRAFRDEFDRCKAFRTRSGTMGVMEWKGQNTTPPSVKVCYRLVRSSNPSSAETLR